ncbi:RNA-directed DNA polymerase, eukaryota, reverse transcriptase zinc-binding domain protein [Tanacetum coccineum]
MLLGLIVDGDSRSKKWGIDQPAVNVLATNDNVPLSEIRFDKCLQWLKKFLTVPFVVQENELISGTHLLTRTSGTGFGSSTKMLQNTKGNCHTDGCLSGVASNVTQDHMHTSLQKQIANTSKAVVVNDGLDQLTERGKQASFQGKLMRTNANEGISADISPFHLPGRKRRRSESQQQRRTRRVVAHRSATHGMAAENLESDSTRSQGRDRKELWKELNLNKRVIGNSTWVIMGDVNVSLKLEDHLEGMSKFTQDMIDFQNCVSNVEIEDISCTGVHFTWTKSLLNPNSKILKKIDRVTSNCKFITHFSNANIVFLPFGISDHIPTIHKIPHVMVKKNKSFRLVNYITDKVDFRELLNWSNGNLFKKAANLKEKLQEVQGKIDKDPTNKELRDEGVEIFKNYIEAAEDEEKLLMQKAKVKWLKEGDKNTAYFHKVLKGMINRSRILSICAEDGTRFKNCEVANQFVKHFEGFLGISPTTMSLTDDDNGLFEKQIPLDEANLMIREVTDDEIKKALFDINDNKAPGPDEFLKGYNCDNGPKRCSFKIDIQKAYDTVCWRFTEDILRRFGFPERMVMWIMTCVASTKFTICVNGERYGYFKGGRGLRHGDPISSYIFTLVMEMLNLLIKDEIRKDKSFKYHFGCRQLKITHLCFADDLIMLSHGDMRSMATLKRALDKFSYISGLYPNLSKCTMFCGSLDDDTKEEISSIFPFKEGKLLVRYLGVPLVTKKIGIAECNQLVEKVRQKLMYWGSVFLLPKSVINEIEKLFKRFLWNNGDSSKGKAKVAWMDVCKPKDQGGLCFKSLEVWNTTLLDVEIDSKDSWGWKCLLNLRSWVGNHMRYKIGDGKSINVWHDKWNSDVSLSSKISKKEIFYAGFKDQDKIQDPDQAIWVDNNGNEKRFSTNTVWKDVRGNHGKVNWYNIVWHSNCIPKHTFLLWIDARNKLCTQDRMCKWYPNKMVSAGSSRSVPADYVPAGHVIISADRYREYADLSYRRN